jgi:hypothetical protein
MSKMCDYIYIHYSYGNKEKTDDMLFRMINYLKSRNK